MRRTVTVVAAFLLGATPAPPPTTQPDPPKQPTTLAEWRDEALKLRGENERLRKLVADLQARIEGGKGPTTVPADRPSKIAWGSRWPIASGLPSRKHGLSRSSTTADRSESEWSRRDPIRLDPDSGVEVVGAGDGVLADRVADDG